MFVRGSLKNYQSDKKKLKLDISIMEECYRIYNITLRPLRGEQKEKNCKREGFNSASERADTTRWFHSVQSGSDFPIDKIYCSLGPQDLQGPTFKLLAD